MRTPIIAAAVLSSLVLGNTAPAGAINSALSGNPWFNYVQDVGKFIGVDISGAQHKVKTQCVVPNKKHIARQDTSDKKLSWSNEHLFYVRSDESLLVNTLLAGSVSGSAGIPLIAQGKTQALYRRSAFSSEQHSSWSILMLRTYGDDNFDTLDSVHEVLIDQSHKPRPPSNAVAWINDCGTQYVSGFQYGAHLAIEISGDSFDQEAQSRLFASVDAAGSGVIPIGGVPVAMDAKLSGEFRKDVDQAASRQTLTATLSSVGSGYLTSAASNVSIPLNASYTSLTKIEDDIISRVGSAQITGPIGLKLSQYPGLDDKYVSASYIKVNLLKTISDGLAQLAPLQARDYTVAPYSYTVVTPDDKKKLEAGRDRVNRAILALQNAAVSCQGAPVTNHGWETHPACADTALALFNDAQDLKRGHSAGMPEPKPMRGHWIDSKPGFDPFSYNQYHSGWNSEDLNAHQDYRIENAYVKAISLIGPGRQNIWYSNKKPAQVVSSSPTATLMLNEAALCGPYIVNQDLNPTYRHLCDFESIRDFIEYQYGIGHSDDSGSIDLKVTNEFGITCQWSVAAVTWSGGNVIAIRLTTTDQVEDATSCYLGE